jgi:Transglutaminase-like superfamily
LVEEVTQMLAAIRLPVRAFDAWWSVCPLTGGLIRHAVDLLPNREFDPVPAIVHSALRYCDNPFAVIPPLRLEEAVRVPDAFQRKVATWHRRLLHLGNSRFLLSVIYAGFRKLVFEDSRSAVQTICCFPEQFDGDRCLQRSLLIAKTSRSFQATGVLFIGAQLPTVQMHAWVIDGGLQPDEQDRIWINYRPLLALVNRKLLRS